MKIFINEKWIDKQEKIEVISPYSKKLIDTVPKTDLNDVETALKCLSRSSVKLSAYERYKILQGAAQEVLDRKDEFSRLISEESGIALKSSIHEVDRAYQALIFSSEEAKRITGETIPADVIPGVTDKFAFTWREPVGVVVAITPFNHPLNQVVHKLGPAIAAGNKVLLKPSEKTPLTAIKFCEILLKNGLPSSMLSVITGEVKVISHALITSPLVDMISFTGSLKVGELIQKKCGIKKICLELGGNGALVILDDADFVQAAKVAVKGAFSNSGQRCTSIKRIVVTPKVADKFIDKFLNQVKLLKWGNPLAPDTDIGTVIDEEAAIRIEDLIKKTLNDGAKLIYGGKRDKALIQPTVLDYVSEDSIMVTNETFGPTAPIIRVKDKEDALRVVNSTIYGLQCGIFTDNIKTAFDFARKVKVGGVVINDGPGFRIESLPFGGVKKSGIGREGIKYAIKEMTNLKTIII